MLKMMKLFNLCERGNRPIKDWIGITEAAKILGISRNTVQKLVEEGILPAYEVTGVKGWQFKRADVQGLIRRVEPKKKRTTPPEHPRE
jgi:excisionase family DNA binding protein